MTGTYEYSPAMWPSLAVVVLACVLATHSWRHRREPGAATFSLTCLFGLAWALGSVLELVSTEPGVAIGWYLFKSAWLLPLVCGVTVFVLQYAGLGRWLSRGRLVWVFVVPPAALGVATLTNPWHGLIWHDLVRIGVAVDASGRGILNWIGLAYYAVLALVNLVVLLRVFVLFPNRRWPAGLMIVGHLVARLTYVLGIVPGGESDAFDPGAWSVGVPLSLYAVAFFGFHVFDHVSEAREVAVNQMYDGLIALDAEHGVEFMNPAAERILGRTSEEVQGLDAAQFLGVDPDSLIATGSPWKAPSHDRPNATEGPRDYVLSATGVTDRSGRQLGHILVLRDVTAAQRAQVRLLDQERALASLRERERLARELHDTLGQVLGYVSMQSQAARKWLEEGDVRRAASLLERLADVARGADQDIREAILALSEPLPGTMAFRPALRDYAADFQRRYDIATEVSTSGDVPESLEPRASAQLLRVVQEAMSNARKHAQCTKVAITVERAGSLLRVCVRDDGRGISASQRNGVPGHFGLQFMRERMNEIQGSLEVSSPPEGGTLVALTVPLRQGGEDT